jgi:hypothetical protein
MKKSVIMISLVFVIIAALVLILLGLLSIDEGGTAPSYSFLAGRNPIKREKAKTGNEDRRYTYSFEADFNDLCSKAHSELTPAGFVVRSVVQIHPGKEFGYRFYYLKEKFPRGLVHIYIYDSRQYIKLPNSNDYGIAPRDGWVMVEIVYGRGWRWPF